MTYAKYPPLSLNTGGSAVKTIDTLDGGSVVPTGANVIPRSSSAPKIFVAALTGAVSEIQVISDIGEFVNMYADLAATIFIGHMVLTPDEKINVDLAAGSSIYLRAAKDVDIDQPNSIISMNFAG